MKKALIVFSVLLVVAIVGTACFGGAVGSDVIKRYWSEGLHLPWSYTNTPTNFDGDFDDVVKGKDIIRSEDFELSLTQASDLILDANACYLRIVPSTQAGDKTLVHYRVYSDISNRDIDYGVQIFTEGSETTVKAAPTIDEITDFFFVPYVEIEVPQSFSVSKFNVLLNACNVEIETDITCANASIEANAGNFELDAKLNVGYEFKATASAANIEIDSLTANIATMTADMGNISFDDCSLIENKADISTSMGNVTLKLPAAKDGGYSIMADVSAGGIDVDKKLNLTKQSNSFYKSGDGKCTINISCSMGGVELKAAD